MPSGLRRLDSAKHFPEDIDGEVHDDGEMWSASLWQIRSAVGRTVANTDILESHFLLTPVSRFRAGAKAIIVADTWLDGWHPRREDHADLRAARHPLASPVDSAACRMSS